MKINTGNLRGHPFKLSVQLTRTNAHKFFFASRVVPIWNSLPTNLVTSPNINSFKGGLNKINLDKFLIFPSIYV